MGDEHASTPGLAHEGYAEDRASAAAGSTPLPVAGDQVMETEREYVEGVTTESDPDAVAEAELTREAEELEAAELDESAEPEDADSPDPNLGK